jgi:hypothetical protein
MHKTINPFPTHHSKKEALPICPFPISQAINGALKSYP